MNNPDICRIFRCSPAELRRLKSAFKTELQQQWAGGAPFLGQSPFQADPDGAIREHLWEVVAQKDKMLGALLAGGRYPENSLPAGFEEGVKAAKKKIFHDFNNEVRRKKQKKGKAKCKGKGKQPATPIRSPSVPLSPVCVFEDRDQSATSSAVGSKRNRRHSRPQDEPGPITSPITRDWARTSLTPSPPSIITVEDYSPDSKRNGDTPDPFSSSSPFPPDAQDPPSDMRLPTTLPAAIKRIQDLEDQVEALERIVQRQDAEIEERVMQRVGHMVARRDRVIEKLRWYLEGDGDGKAV